MSRTNPGVSRTNPGVFPAGALGFPISPAFGVPMGSIPGRAGTDASAEPSISSRKFFYFTIKIFREGAFPDRVDPYRAFTNNRIFTHRGGSAIRPAHVLWTLLLTAALFLSSLPAAAQPNQPPGSPGESAPDRAFALLKSAVYEVRIGGSCATAFAIGLGNKLLTNAHVVMRGCRSPTCQAVLLRAAEGGGSGHGSLAETFKGTVTVELLLGGLDLAVISLPPEAAGLNPLPIAYDWKAQSGATLYSATSGGCGVLHFGATAVGTVERSWFSTDTPVSYGASGGPLVTADGRVVGMYFEFSSLIDGMLARVVHRPAAGNALSLTSAAALLGGPLEHEPFMLWELATLADRYRREVAPATGRRRLLTGMEFLRKVHNVRSAAFHGANPVSRELIVAVQIALSPPESLEELARMWPTPAARPLERAAAEVALAALLEQSALEQSAAPRVQAAESSSHTGASGRDAMSREDLLTLFPLSQEAGAGVTIRRLLRAAGVLILSLVVLWSLSLGYVYAMTTGSRARRVAMTVLVAFLFWPLSWFLWRFSRRFL